MSRTSRYAFILAKLYGIVARSFAGSAYRDLLRLKSLSELADRLFPGERGRPDAAPLPREVEARIVRGSLDAMTAVLDYLGDPPELLVHAARRLEYQSAKALVRALGHGGADDLRVWDLGAYSGFRVKDARDPEKTLRSSIYSWALPLAAGTPTAEVENRLDRHYYQRLLELAETLPLRDRQPVLRLVRTEVALTNLVWALRLRFFFRYELEKARPLMIPGMSAGVRQAVEAAFEIAADAPEDWRRWRYGWLLSDQLGETFTGPDPVRAEQKASQYLYARARKSFHQNPFTLGPVLAFFRLKEHEAAMLNVAAEALQLSIPEQDVAAITGAR